MPGRSRETRKTWLRVLDTVPKFKEAGSITNTATLSQKESQKERQKAKLSCKLVVCWVRSKLMV